MTAITVKNIPDSLYEHLKVAAHTHRRSINSELIVCLEKVLLPQKTNPQEHIAAARALRKQVKAPILTEEDINLAKNTGRK